MINKLKELSINFALIAFSCFIIKMLIMPASFADSIIVLVLGSLYGYTQYLKRFQPYNLDAAVAKDLMEVKKALSTMNVIKASEKLEKKTYF